MPQITKKVIVLVNAMSSEEFPIRFGEVNSAWFPGFTRERFLRHGSENRCHELPKLQRVTPAFAQHCLFQVNKQTPTHSPKYRQIYWKNQHLKTTKARLMCWLCFSTFFKPVWRTSPFRSTCLETRECFVKLSLLAFDKYPARFCTVWTTRASLQYSMCRFAVGPPKFIIQNPPRKTLQQIEFQTSYI